MLSHPAAGHRVRPSEWSVCSLPPSPLYPVGLPAERVASKGSWGHWKEDRPWKKEAVRQQGWIPVIAKLKWTLLLLMYHLFNKPCWQLGFSSHLLDEKERTSWVPLPLQWNNLCLSPQCLFARPTASFGKVRPWLRVTRHYSPHP